MVTSRTILGLAVGSGLEGVDAALVRVEGLGLSAIPKVIKSQRPPFAPDLRESLLVKLNPPPVRAVSEALATAARRMLSQSGLGGRELFAIGLWTPGGGAFATAAETIADQTGITVVTGFAARDIAAGGRGGPLTPASDFLIARDANEDRLLIHLGAVASLVHLPANGKLIDVVAFDAGPGNRFLDLMIQRCTGQREHCDVGGHRAVQGRCDQELLESWSRHPFFQRRPPKGISTTDFDDDFIARCIEEAQRLEVGLNDLLCIAAHFVIRAVGSAVRQWLNVKSPRGIYLTGGGMRNGFLRQLLAQQFPGEVLHSGDAIGLPALARKAAAAAVLTALTLDGVTGNLPQLTGASSGRLLGRLVPGDPRNWAAACAWAAEQMGEYVQEREAA